MYFNVKGIHTKPTNLKQVYSNTATKYKLNNL